MGDHCHFSFSRRICNLIGRCISSLKSQQITLAESHIVKKLKAAFFGEGKLKEYWKKNNSLARKNQS